MNKKLLFFSAIYMLVISFGYSQKKDLTDEPTLLEEVVVTNSKFELKRENSGKVITKITQKELVQMQGKTIAEIINTTSGIEINGVRSNAGQNLSYFVRGGRNRQVLILIDGIAVSDASQIANDYDLRLLNPDQVESIEILKGASSTLYGSGAATAVVNIKLKEASNNSFSGNFRSVLGSNQSQKDKNYALKDFRNSVSLSGTLNKLTYLASFGNQFTNGLSAIENGTEPDPYNSINGNLKLGYKFSDFFKFKIYGSFDKFKAAFDDGFAYIDADNLAITNQYRLGISPELNYNKGSLVLNAAYNNINRRIDSDYPARFNAESLTADFYNRYNFNSRFYTVLGLNFQENRMESYFLPFGGNELVQSIDPENSAFTIIDPYVNVIYESNFGLSVNSGIRLNNHSEYGSHFVYSINPSYKVDMEFGYLKGLTSYSTAYITPSLYQLFEPIYGNNDLKPEENSTIELGAEIGFENKGTISLVYFNRRETNFIDFVDLGSWVYQYKNIDEEFTVSGLEIMLNYKFTNKVIFTANGTLTKVQENLNLRIPDIKINAQLNYQFNPKTFISITCQFNDEREDAFFNNVSFITEEVILKNYSLIDFYISRKIIKDKMMVFANVTNLLNEDYQELYGYSTKGRNVNIGFNLSL